MAEIDHKSYPAAFCLLGDKKSATYKKVFEVLKSFLVKPGETELRNPPQTLLVDFETAISNQFKSVFKEVREITGCYTHFRRNLWRHLGEIGLHGWHGQSEVSNVFANCIPSLCFVPENEVQDYYQALLREMLPEVYKEIEDADEEEGDDFDVNSDNWIIDAESKANLRENIEAYLHYIETNYVGIQTRCGWTSPRFPIAIWNQYQNVLHDRQQTTNRSEGRNAYLRQKISTGASVWQVIEAFSDCEAKARSARDEDRAKIPAGGRPHDEFGFPAGPGSSTAREKNHSVANFELKNLVLHREEYGKAQYLRRLAFLKRKSN